MEILVLGTAGYLMATAIGETGMYYLTPGELTAKVKGDSTFYDTGVKMGARVVPGTIDREPGGQRGFVLRDRWERRSFR